VTAGQLSTHLKEQLKPFCSRLYSDQNQSISEVWQAQALPFCLFHEAQLVTELFELEQDNPQLKQFRITTASGLVLRARALFICAGAGAFLPKKPAIPQLDNFENNGVFYQVPSAEILQNKTILIQGDDEAALQASIDLALNNSKLKTALPIYHIHRREVFTATENTQTQFKQLQKSGQIVFIAGQVKALHAQQNAQFQSSLESIEISLSATGESFDLSAQIYCPLLGLSPKLGPLQNWGLALEQKHLPVQLPYYSTEINGIYAVGDVNHYPGKRKLLVTGFHEATMAAYDCAEQLKQGKVLLQYTSASKQLQTRLGIKIE
jgi:thioredoxin reductase (NADPH)